MVYQSAVLQALLLELTVNGIHGPAGVPAASPVIMVELRAEQGQARKSKRTGNAMGLAMRIRHAGLGRVRVRSHKKFNITSWYIQKFLPQSLVSGRSGSHGALATPPAEMEIRHERGLGNGHYSEERNARGTMSRPKTAT